MPQCLSPQGASIDMQHDLLRQHDLQHDYSMTQCDLDLAWPEVKFYN